MGGNGLMVDGSKCKVSGNEDQLEDTWCKKGGNGFLRV